MKWNARARLGVAVCAALIGTVSPAGADAAGREWPADLAPYFQCVKDHGVLYSYGDGWEPNDWGAKLEAASQACRALDLPAIEDESAGDDSVAIEARDSVTASGSPTGRDKAVGVGAVAKSRKAAKRAKRERAQRQRAARAKRDRAAMRDIRTGRENR